MCSVSHVLYQACLELGIHVCKLALCTARRCKTLDKLQSSPSFVLRLEHWDLLPAFVHPFKTPKLCCCGMELIFSLLHTLALLSLALSSCFLPFFLVCFVFQCFSGLLYDLSGNDSMKCVALLCLCYRRSSRSGALKSGFKAGLQLAAAGAGDVLSQKIPCDESAFWPVKSV